MYDIQFRENDVTALDTATGLTEKGADSPGAFVVPMHASAITEVMIGAVGDYTADAAHNFLAAVRLTGPGLNAPESWLIGPAGSTDGAAATTAGMGGTDNIKRYVCNIPVVKGQRINAYGFMHGSADCGSIRVGVWLVFDGPVKGNAKYYDYREGDSAAANTPVTITGRGGIAEGDFDVGSGTICDVAVVVSNCPVAGPLAALTLHKFSGNGLVVAGDYEFAGNGLFTQDDITISGTSWTSTGIDYKTSISTKNGAIRVQVQEIEDDVGTPTHGVCLGFL